MAITKSTQKRQPAGKRPHAGENPPAGKTLYVEKRAVKKTKDYQTQCKKMKQGNDRKYCYGIGLILNKIKEYEKIERNDIEKYKKSVNNRIDRLLGSDGIFESNPIYYDSERNIIKIVINENKDLLKTGKIKSLNGLIKHNNAKDKLPKKNSVKKVNPTKEVIEKKTSRKSIRTQCEKNLGIDTRKTLSETDKNRIKGCIEYIKDIKDKFKCIGDTHVVAPTCRKNPQKKK